MNFFEQVSLLILTVSAFSGDFSETPVSLETTNINTDISNYNPTILNNEVDTLENDNLNDQSTRYWLLTVKRKLNDVEAVVHFVSVPSAISSLLVILLLIMRTLYGIRSKKLQYPVRPNILHPDEIVHLRHQTYV